MLNVEHSWAPQVRKGVTMTVLAWDEPGEKIYQTGIDRGVLYLNDGTVASWNGLTSVEEDSGSEVKPFYLEGTKFLQNFIVGDFEAKLKAFTYPEEFDQVNGVSSISPGFDIYEQPVNSFGLSYRTKVGSDLSSDFGYKIHILYDVIANPDTVSYNTLDDSAAAPTEFGWSLTGTPQKLVGYRPTVHISIDSTQTPPDVMQLLEDQLYGTETSDPRLPPMSEIAGYFGYLGSLIIVDHGDGSWSAIDGSDSFIVMTDDTTFSIHDADATYLDADTYTISSTSPD
jgi:hypothetical protein